MYFCFFNVLTICWERRTDIFVFVIWTRHGMDLECLFDMIMVIRKPILLYFQRNTFIIILIETGYYYLFL